MKNRAHIPVLLFLLSAIAVAFALPGKTYAQASNGDCLGAIPVCYSIYDVPTLAVPPDNVQNEISGALSCLANGEENGVWYTFTVQTSGILSFNIIPYVGTNDYDWAVFDLTNADCSNISSNAALEVSCNFSSSVTNGGITGPNGGINPQDEPVINVVAGQRFVLYISNFSQTTNGYKLDFTGSTAQVPDNVDPRLLTATPNNPCGANRIRLDFSENISCNSVSASDFTVSGPGGPYTVVSASGQDCAAGSAYSDVYTLAITPSISTGGVFSVSVSGSVADICGNPTDPNAAPLVFNYNALVLDSAVVDASCGVNDGQATVIVTGGTLPYQYLWSDPLAQTTATATNLARGTYTVTVRDNNNCSNTLRVIVGDPTSFTFTLQEIPDTCSKGVGVLSVTVTGTTPPYTYNWDGISNNNPVYTTATGDSLFNIRITDVLGCWLDTTFVVQNITNDTMEAVYVVDQQAVNFLAPYVYFTNTSIYYDTFIWDTPDGPNTNNAFMIEFPDTGHYPITITTFDVNGCRDSFTLVIYVYAEFAMFIPSAFTVNDDLLNDVWKVEGTGIDKSTFEMRIFDRWGQCIFETTDITSGWNGAVNGRTPLDSQMGAYAYKINVYDVYGNPHQFVGKVIMLK